MVNIYVPSGGVQAIEAEIRTIEGKIRAIDSSVAFFEKQLNGAPAVNLFTEAEIEANPSLKSEQKELFPAVVGAIQRDATYEVLLFPELQDVVDAYEDERVELDGQFGNFTIPPPFGPGSGVFDENCVQVSGGNRILPLFNPSVSVIEPANPGQMFGGTGSAPNKEIAQITIELASIATLLTGACQVGPPIPVTPCQDAKTDLLNCLKARYDSTGPSGLLLAQEAALNANPDLGQFTSNPLGNIAAEKLRITAFITAINSVPMNTAIPPATLTANQTAATARQTYITGTRIPEMNGFLNTTPGYYNTRFQTLRLRVAGSGTLQQVNFLQQAIADAAVERAALVAEEAFLRTLLPPM